MMTATRRRLTCLMLLTLLAFPAAQAGPVTLPDIGESTEIFMSLEEEQRLGEDFMRSLRHSLDIINDPLLNGYINELGARLTGMGTDGKRQFHFFIVNAPDINAFAGPGGYIGLHSGLILEAQDEKELAGVMAHEIAHVTQRHLARAYQEASRLSLPLTAAVIAAIILGRDNINITEAAIAATTAGAIQHQINFTRENEKDADRTGLQILATSGFDPRGMPLFFERLQRAALFQDDQPQEFLRTHPVTHNRIADTLSRAEQYPENNHAANDTRFAFMQAHLRVLVSHSLEREQAYFRQALRASRRNNSARYGLALSFLMLDKPEQAQKHLQRLQKQDDIDPLATGLLAARLALYRNRPNTALATYSELGPLYPNHPGLIMAHGEALIGQARLDEAVTLFETAISRGLDLPEIYKLLAQALNAREEIARAHAMLAEYHFLNGETHTALQHLDIARRHNRDKTFKRQLDARQREMQMRNGQGH